MSGPGGGWPPAAGLAQPWPLALLRLGVVLAAVLFFAAPLTTFPGMLAAAAGTVAGTLIAARLARSRLRFVAALLGGLGLAAAGLLAAQLTTAWPLVSELLGPPGALLLAELQRWFLLSLAVAGTLRFASARRRSAALLEAVLVIASLALAVAAHRDGAFHRPLVLGDWAWSRGIDPARLLLVLGALTGLTLVPLLLGDLLRRLGRNLLSLGLLALGILLLAGELDRATPPRSDAAGLQGEGQQGGAGDGQGRAGKSRTSRAPANGDGLQGSTSGHGQEPEQFPFLDDPPSNASEAAVAVVVFHDDFRPTTGPYYFRQVAFSQYNGRRLVQATRDDADRDLLTSFPVEREEVALPESPGAHRRVSTTVALLADHRQPLGLLALRELAPLPNPQVGRFVRTYRVGSVVTTAGYEQMLLAPAGDEGWSAELAQHYLALPDDPRYRALAEEATAFLAPGLADLPLPRALAVRRWLDGHVTYSRRSSHARADDPVASFLFGDRFGYCIHIAHAAVYLLRSLGVPARVGAGYAVDESHAGGSSSLLIRAGNAHAWPEVYLRGFGWVVVDPRPERSEDPALGPPDPVLQRMLGEMARSGSSGGRSPAAPPPRDLFGGSWGLRPLLLTISLALAALLLLYLVKLWRRLAPALAAGPDLTRVAYRAATDRLAEVSQRRRTGETRPAFARRVAGLSPSYRPLTELCVAACLGWPRPAAAREQVRELLRRQGRELQAAIPWWRRLLGLLDPTAWLRTR